MESDDKEVHLRQTCIGKTLAQWEDWLDGYLASNDERLSAERRVRNLPSAKTYLQELIKLRCIAECKDQEGYFLLIRKLPTLT